MNISVTVPASTPGPAINSSQPIASSENPAPILPSAATASANHQVDDLIAHMRRRLFRTLDQPDRPMIAIECGSVSLGDLEATTGQFLSDTALRDSHNLVLAVPTDNDFTNSMAFDVIQFVKHSSFENGFDGKVSWLLIQEPTAELAALQTLVGRQGGKWHASV